MNNNIRIAKELVRMARMMIAESMNSFATEYIANVRQYIDECFNSNYVTSSHNIKYIVRYDTEDRNFKLIRFDGGRNVPSDESVNENEIKELYNNAVKDVKANFNKIDGYDKIEQNSTDYESAKKLAFNIINSNCLVNAPSVCIKFFIQDNTFYNTFDNPSDYKDSGVRQQFNPNGFNICE